MPNIVYSHLRHQWFFDLVQLASVMLEIYWCRKLPVPGYAIAVLAFLAVVMTFHATLHTEMALWQKGTWVALAGLLQR